MSDAQKQFAAEVVFLDPADLPRAIEALALFGLNYKIDHDAIDPGGPTVFGFVTGTTELAEADIGCRVMQIVEPLGGAVVEWSYRKATDAPLRCGHED